MIVFQPGTGLKSFDSYRWTITICMGLAFYLLFSEHFKKIRRKNKFLWYLSNLGMMPALALAVFVGPLAGEIPWPTYDSNIFTRPDFFGLFSDWTIFGKIPFPPFKMFITGLPMVISAYIVVFGDVIQSPALLDDAQKYRPDEDVSYNPNRSHIIFGGRNFIMSALGPDISMCGPIWAAMQVVVCERYKTGSREYLKTGSRPGMPAPRPRNRPEMTMETPTRKIWTWHPYMAIPDTTPSPIP